MAPLPSQIGRYEIKSLIGRGGMGDLYLAHDPNTNRLVALKLLNATLDSTELRERFAREARALAALNHPNIVNIYDTGEFDDSPFIVMEYVRGETLAEMIKRRATLSISQKLKLVAELCAGLAQAHEAGIIHRDIKPANLMVDQQGRLKILDFGIARVAEGNKTRVGLPLTQVNMMIGTPGYMSPEQIEGGEVDHRSDIFAVGAVCYELLSYDAAFSGTNTRQIERRVLLGQTVPLAAVVPGIDPEIDEIVLRALKKDPNKRYQDATTFERALERLRSRLAQEIPGTAHRATVPPPQSSKARNARAEAAYRRALAAYQGGAHEAAKRFAVEAVAEDPSHAQARALLSRLEHRAPPAAAQSTAASTQASASGTAVSDTAAGGTEQTLASAPTILIAPRAGAQSVAGQGTVTAAREAATRAARTPGRGSGSRSLWSSDGPVGRWFERLRESRVPAGTRREPVWLRYRSAGLAVAALATIALVLAIVFRFAFGPSGQLLTITRPEGGTITAPGINCGTRGIDCSISRPSGEVIELTPEADAGFTFVGYTGDCAPGGRALMTVARTCGATFTPGVPEAPAGATQVLTISPVPTGGTLEGVDIICGTKGSICSAKHPEGVPVDLHPTADPGFTFMGFIGDCVPLGHTQMTAPRTCSATFSPTAVVSATPPPTPPGGSRGGSAGRGAAPSRGAAPPPTPQAQATTDTTITLPPPPARSAPVVDSPAVASAGAAAKPIAPPPTDEEYAKRRIQDVLKEYCDAYEAIDPAAVQRVYPKVDLNSLKLQLNKSRYRSVQCKFGDPVFVALDSSVGSAKVQAEVKRVFEHTILTEKPQTLEAIAVMTLVRSSLRSPWQIDSVTYKQK